MKTLVILYYSIFGWPDLWVGTSPDGKYQIWNIYGVALGCLPFSDGVMRVTWRVMTKDEILQHRED